MVLGCGIGHEGCLIMHLEHLSASRIKTFKQCQLQYYAQYELKVPQPPPHPLTTAGSCLHKVFEDAVDNLKRGLPFDYEAAFCKQCTEFGVRGEEAILIRELGQNALDWGYERNIKNCVGTEVKFEEKLPDGTLVTGYIDRLDIYKGKADIIDLKTQKSEFDDSKLRDEWQSVIYNWAARRLYPEIEGDIRVAYWVLRHRVQRCSMSKEDAERGEELLMRTAEEIRSCTAPVANPSGLCPWCCYSDQCQFKGAGLKTRFKGKYK
jgi:RecB family exonuclease